MKKLCIFFIFIISFTQALGMNGHANGNAEGDADEQTSGQIDLSKKKKKKKSKKSVVAALKQDGSLEDQIKNCMEAIERKSKGSERIKIMQHALDLVLQLIKESVKDTTVTAPGDLYKKIFKPFGMLFHPRVPEDEMPILAQIFLNQEITFQHDAFRGMVFENLFRQITFQDDLSPIKDRMLLIMEAIVVGFETQKNALLAKDLNRTFMVVNAYRGLLSWLNYKENGVEVKNLELLTDQLQALAEVESEPKPFVVNFIFPTLAEVMVMRGNIPAAIKWSQKAIKAPEIPSKIYSYLKYVILLESQDCDENAEKICDELFELLPKYPNMKRRYIAQAYFLRSLILQKRTHATKGKAQERYRVQSLAASQFIFMTPGLLAALDREDQSRLYEIRANLSMQLDQIENALRYYSKIVTLEGVTNATRYNASLKRGDCLLRLGRLSEVEAALSEVLKQDEYVELKLDAHVVLGIANGQGQNPDWVKSRIAWEYAKENEKHLEDDRRAALWFYYGLACYKTGLLEAAEEVLQKALALSNSHSIPESRLLLAEVNLMQGKYKEGLDALGAMLLDSDLDNKFTAMAHGVGTLLELASGSRKSYFKPNSFEKYKPHVQGSVTAALAYYEGRACLSSDPEKAEKLFEEARDLDKTAQGIVACAVDRLQTKKVLEEEADFLSEWGQEHIKRQGIKLTALESARALCKNFISRDLTRQEKDKEAARAREKVCEVVEAFASKHVAGQKARLMPGYILDSIYKEGNLDRMLAMLEPLLDNEADQQVQLQARSLYLMLQEREVGPGKMLELLKKPNSRSAMYFNSVLNGKNTNPYAWAEIMPWAIMLEENPWRIRPMLRELAEQKDHQERAEWAKVELGSKLMQRKDLKGAKDLFADVARNGSWHKEEAALYLAQIPS